MVAYTPDLCLPYYTGGDSPCLNTGTVCEPSSVWCDLVNLVEGYLDDLDDVVARTATAKPIAQVSYVPATAVTVSGVVPFNIVDLDTDNMVDLPVFSGITPNRNGLYQIDAEMQYASAADNAVVQGYILAGNANPFPSLTATTTINGIIAVLITRGASTAPNTTAPLIRASMLWQFDDTTPQPRSISLYSAFTGSVLTSATLTAYWHSDVI